MLKMLIIVPNGSIFALRTQKTQAPMTIQTLEEITQIVNSSSSKSKSNSNELERIAKELNYSNIRFLIAPDREVSKEGLVEDVLCLFKAIQNPQSITPTFSTKNR
ncbi:MAG: hypothetical protein KA797_02775 [Chitinophagales bacterium]|nr:hypothetical protein [Chitinophagales bacterium]